MASQGGAWLAGSRAGRTIARPARPGPSLECLGSGDVINPRVSLLGRGRPWRLGRLAARRQPASLGRRESQRNQSSFPGGPGPGATRASPGCGNARLRPAPLDPRNSRSGENAGRCRRRPSIPRESARTLEQSANRRCRAGSPSAIYPKLSINVDLLMPA
jgi:hypothetical protein